MKDSADIRKINLQKIRRILWSGQWKTKQQIAGETGLSVATCNTLLNELANTEEVISEKIRLHNVGPGALRYKCNEEYEQLLCIFFDKEMDCDVLTLYVLTMTGNVTEKIEKNFFSLSADILQDEVKNVADRYHNIISIMVGIPGIAENGTIQHCDISDLNGFSLVSALSIQFGCTVYMENDMHFKVFGYYQKYCEDYEVVTLANFPVQLLPGTATVHNGMVIKGKNQFAGMVGFLPFDSSRNEILEQLQPKKCQPIVSKSIASLIAIQNPATIVLTGELLSEQCTDWIYRDCLQWIPKEYMPLLVYQSNMDEYYLEGMYQKALELKGVI